MKTGEDAGPSPSFVREDGTPLGVETPPTFDVLVCGGTLGIFMATALQMRFARATVGVVCTPHGGDFADFSLHVKIF